MIINATDHDPFIGARLPEWLKRASRGQINTLRTSLLDDAKKRVTESLRPWEQRLQETGGTLCSDGWSDAANRPLLILLAVIALGA